jgi:8-amino-7-oxononanoate synthase
MRFFYESLTQEPQWQSIQQNGHLQIYIPQNWRNQSFLSPIIVFVTKIDKCAELKQFLMDKGYLTRSVRFPVVPRDSERVRLVIQSDTTQQQILGLVKAATEWASSQLVGYGSKSSGPLQSRL